MRSSSMLLHPIRQLMRLSFVLIVSCRFQAVHGFSSSRRALHGHQLGHPVATPSATTTDSANIQSTTRLLASSDDNAKSSNHDKDDDDDDTPDENDEEFHQQLQSRHDHLQVEKTRTALEQQHTQSFLKRRPIKLPYNDARKWVQANLGASTKEEYDDLVANGNLRTPYIPKQPEEYYTSTREWISWDHFLTGVFDDEQPSEIRPSTGVFD